MHCEIDKQRGDFKRLGVSAGGITHMLLTQIIEAARVFGGNG